MSAVFQRPRTPRELARPMAQVVRGLMLHADPLRALRELEREGSTRAAEYVKAAVAAMTSANTAELIGNGAAVDFLESVGSYFDALRTSALQVPLNSAGARVITASGSASAVAEGVPKPLHAMTTDLQPPSPLKATSLVVLTKELAKSDGALSLIESALRNNVATATDAAALPILAAGATSVTASGTTSAALLTDLRAALVAIPSSAGARFVAAAAPSLLKRIALLGDSSGALAFPDVDCASGGDINGVRFVPSDALTTTIVVVDASQIVIADGAIEVRRSDEASLQFESAPTNPPTASTVVVSLFQSNEVAVLAERFFGLAKVRATAAAQITGANYGG